MEIIITAIGEKQCEYLYINKNQKIVKCFDIQKARYFAKSKKISVTFL